MREYLRSLLFSIESMQASMKVSIKFQAASAINDVKVVLSNSVALWNLQQTQVFCQLDSLAPAM
jgi:hypothetical protein